MQPGNWSINIWEVDLLLSDCFLDWGFSWFSVDQHDNRQAKESTRTARTITSLAPHRNVLSRKTFTCVGSFFNLENVLVGFSNKQERIPFFTECLKNFLSWSKIGFKLNYVEANTQDIFRIAWKTKSQFICFDTNFAEGGGGLMNNNTVSFWRKKSN